MQSDALRRQIYDELVQALLGSAPSPAEAAHLALLLAYHPRREDADVFAVFEAHVGQMLANVQAPLGRLGAFHPPNFDAWVLAHIGDDDLVVSLAAFDASLIARLADDETPTDHGIRRGLAGAALYALERWRRGDQATAGPMLAHVARRLRNAARYDQHGCYWTTGYDPQTDELSPGLATGYQNLGVLHGLPGVISVLGAIAETGAVACADLVADGARWVLAQFNEDTAYPSRLADVAGMPEIAERGVTAWCRGDIGALVALWNGLRRAGLDETPLMPHVDYALARERALTAVPDAALCHGAAGLAHLWHRIYLATGSDAYQEAARAQLGQVRVFHRESLGFGGYGAWTKTPDEPRPTWKSTPSFLEGSVGVALAMQASWLDDEPAWDRLLAIDIPPGPAASR